MNGGREGEFIYGEFGWNEKKDLTAVSRKRFSA
jgi:hypothetical protein